MAVCRETHSNSLKLPQHRLQDATRLPSAGMVIQGSIALLEMPALAPVRVTVSSMRLVSAPGRAVGGTILYSPPGAGAWCDGEHTDHTTDTSEPPTPFTAHCLAFRQSIFLLLFVHILSHTKSKQTKPNFPCFSSHYWNFPCSSLVLFSLRYEHSRSRFLAAN